jgi:hypothetical protein
LFFLRYNKCKYTHSKHSSIWELHILHLTFITQHYVSKVETCNCQWSQKHFLYILVIRLMMATVICWSVYLDSSVKFGCLHWVYLHFWINREILLMFWRCNLLVPFLKIVWLCYFLLVSPTNIASLLYGGQDTLSICVEIM